LIRSPLLAFKASKLYLFKERAITDICASV